MRSPVSVISMSFSSTPGRSALKMKASFVSFTSKLGTNVSAPSRPPPVNHWFITSKGSNPISSCIRWNGSHSRVL